MAVAGLWLAVVAGVAVHAGLKPHSNTLYKVFHSGGARWLAGENLYPHVDEYIYSPFAAAFFAPFALLPDGVAGVLWRLICIAACAGGIAAWLRPVPRELAVRAWLLILPLSAGDFFNGQANPLMIGLLMLAILACRRERWFLAALCVAICTYFKVYPLAMGLLLCVLHPRKFPLRLVLAIALLFGLSLVLQHPAYAWAQYVNWVHSLPRDPRRTLNYFGTYRDFWLILRVLRVPINVQGWAVLQAASGAALALYLFLLRRRGLSPELLDLLLLALGTCWMLLFGPATESSTYMILAPSLALVMLRWLDDRKYLPFAAIGYAFLIASQMITSWAHLHQSAYTHLIQPVGTLIFVIPVTVYGLKQSAFSERQIRSTVNP